MVAVVCARPIDGLLHLLRGGNEAVGLFCELMLLTVQYISFGLRDIDGRAGQLALLTSLLGGAGYVESQRALRTTVATSVPRHQAQTATTYLGLSCVALMARNPNLIEQLVQLSDDGGHLLLQVARVHDRNASSAAASGLCAHAKAALTGVNNRRRGMRTGCSASGQS